MQNSRGGYENDCSVVRCWEEKHKQIPSFTPTFYVPVVGKRNQNFIRFSPSPTFNVSVVGK
jgi:hypothetical protein